MRSMTEPSLSVWCRKRRDVYKRQLYEKGKREVWDGTKIEKGEGKIIAANQRVISVVCNEFQYWMKLAEEQQDKMSEAQKQKIVQRMKDIGEDIKNYDMYQDFLDDRSIQEK